MIFGTEINTWFTIIYLILGVPLVAVELYGVARRPGGRGGGDTISENWYWLRNKVRVLVAPMALFLGWLFYHFVFEGWG